MHEWKILANQKNKTICDVSEFYYNFPQIKLLPNLSYLNLNTSLYIYIYIKCWPNIIII